MKYWQWQGGAAKAGAFLVSWGLWTGAAQAEAVALSTDAQAVLQHLQRTGDNAGMPFMLIDKRDARVWVFDGQGRLKDSTPVLLGLARGDNSTPGIGERELSQIAEAERTTPAGRFVVEPGRNLHGEDILWIDYDAAVSMHRVRPLKASERRLQRLASRTPADNRISYGCINVDANFYDRVLRPTFTRQRGVAYVLPETRPVLSLFGSRSD